MHVFIVEDTLSDYQELFDTCLAIQPCIVYHATTIQQALDTFPHYIADRASNDGIVMFIDMHLPSDTLTLDGYYLIAHLRNLMNQKQCPIFPIVAISSDMNERRSHLSVEAGAAMVCEKPLTVDQVHTAFDLIHELPSHQSNMALLTVASEMLTQIFTRKPERTMWTDADMQLVLTALTPAFHFSLPSERTRADDLIAQQGGKHKILHGIEQYRSDLRAGIIPIAREDLRREELDKLLAMMLHGVAQGTILRRSGYGRTRLRTNLHLIAQSLATFFNNRGV